MDRGELFPLWEDQHQTRLGQWRQNTFMDLEASRLSPFAHINPKKAISPMGKVRALDLESPKPLKRKGNWAGRLVSE